MAEINRNRTVSLELRRIILRMIDEEGKSQREVSRVLQIPRTTIESIMQSYRATNSILPCHPAVSHRRILTEEIKARIRNLVNDNTTVTIDEIQRNLDVGVHNTTIWRWVRSLGYTYKMTRPIYERRNDDRTKEDRFVYVNWYLGLSHLYRYRNLIFIDESPFSLHMFRGHSWAPRGQTPNPIIHPRRQNVTMILAISGSNLIHCEAITSGVNATIFGAFLTTIFGILGTVEPFTLVMDNVRFHHSSTLPTSPNISFIYLPPYSPFLNPCEEVFAFLKNNVRRDTAPIGTNELITRMRNAAQLIQDVNVSNYFSHCESFFGACQRRESIGRD